MKSCHQRCFASTLFLLFIHTITTAQDQRTFNQNSSRSNHTRAYNQNAARSNSGLTISFAPLYSSAMNTDHDSLLFRGSGAGFRLGADYFFGKAGISFSSGFSTSSTDDAAINRFLKNASIPQDQLLISTSRQQNMYLLLGPSVRFGNMVEVYAHAKGGLFINNSGLVSMQQRGSQRAAYRNESTDKSIYPGFLAGIGINYKTKSEIWSFGIGADYMNTRSEVNNYDVRRGGGIEPMKLSRNITDMVTGITVRYAIFSPRDQASGQSTGKRSREAGSGMATGRRTREAGSGMSTGRRTYQPGQPVYGNITSDESCGTVTQRITNPDGTTEETTFACPADAADYNNLVKIDGGMPNRISMNVTTPKQTQGATFGEKVNQGLHAAGSALAQGAGKNIISGRLTWPSSGAGMGIVTNRAMDRGGSVTMNSQTSSTRQTQQSSFGTLVRLSGRDASSGMASGKRSRETGSGMSTGRRQYEPLFAEGGGDVCNPCVAIAKMSGIKNNPLYNDKGTSGNNPLYKGSNNVGGGDDDCDGISGISVMLADPQSGAIIARTTTEACGSFFFANVPDGDFVVKVSGRFAGKKGYDVSLSSKTDILGKIEQSGQSMQLEIHTGNEEESNQQKAGISTSRSNIRTRSLTIIEADTDGDGVYESTKVLAELMDGTSKDITADTRLSQAGVVKKVTVRGWNPEKKQAVTGSTSDVKEYTISIDSDNKAVLTNQYQNGTKDEMPVTAKVSHHPNVVQYNISLDENETGSRFKTKTKSNQSNDRLADDTDDDGIWSPRSNIKMIGMATGDLDGDGSPDIAAGNISREAIKQHFENGDQPTQQRPGNPIGGLTIKGGKNPGGNLRTVQTDGNGEFEYTGLEAGEYTFIVEQTIFIDDETFVSTGSNSNMKVQDHNSSRSNKSASVISNETGGNNTKVQDHNSSRSNKSASVITNETGGNNTKVQDHNSSRSNKTASNIVNDPGNGDEDERKGDVKLTASQNSQSLRTINTSRSNIKNMLASLDDLEELLDNDAVSSRYLVNTSRSNIKNQRLALYDLRETLADMPYMDKAAATDELSKKIAVMNNEFLSLQESLKAMGGQYTTISNVLKTKHDTAKNSIGNIR
ncbi:MAG: carboxypeptidase regulatory-like domain-containing protein [Chitinophagaceae bacterium]|nr:carboxypeptidase regulatory-like domain-containing protein [Chitinophagaceae bacterium]